MKRSVIEILRNYRLRTFNNFLFLSRTTQMYTVVNLISHLLLLYIFVFKDNDLREKSFCKKKKSGSLGLLKHSNLWKAGPAACPKATHSSPCTALKCCVPILLQTTGRCCPYRCEMTETAEPITFSKEQTATGLRHRDASEKCQI